MFLCQNDGDSILDVMAMETPSVLLALPEGNPLHQWIRFTKSD